MLERLLESKKAWTAQERELGKQAGEDWAINIAEFGDLLILKKFMVDIENYGYVSGLDVEEKLEYENLWNAYGDDDGQVSDDFATGFVEGALRVKDKL